MSYSKNKEKAPSHLWVDPTLATNLLVLSSHAIMMKVMVCLSL
jgi:hypothetical protein